MLIADLRSRVNLRIEGITTGEQAMALTRAGLEAGVGMVVLDPGPQSTRVALERLMPLVGLARNIHVPLLLTGRVDIALALGLDGVWVGDEDMPVAYVRRLLGPSAIVGAAVATARDARIAEQDGATFVSVGTVGDSPDKQGPAMLDLARLKQVAGATSLPVCVAGSQITAGYLEQISAGGAQLLVMTSAPSPDATREAVAQAVKLAAAHLKPRHVAP